MVTKTLLFVSVVRDSELRPAPSSTEQWSDPADGRRLVYIFDKRSGQQLGPLPR
jgi:hypothetical protein